MAVTELGAVSGSAFLSGNITLNETTTPVANDRILVRVWNIRDGVTCTGVTGLGVTWNKIVNTPDADQDLQLWMATGATVSGNISINFNGGAIAQAKAVIVRGLTLSAVDSSVSDLGSTGSVPGASKTAGADQYVITFGYSSKLTSFTGTSPASGWTNDALVQAGGGGNWIGHSSRIPTSSATHQATGINSDSGVGQQIIAVIGTATVPTDRRLGGIATEVLVSSTSPERKTAALVTEVLLSPTDTQRKIAGMATEVLLKVFPSPSAYVNENVGVSLPTETQIHRQAAAIGVTPIKTEDLTVIGNGEASAYVNVNVTT